MIDGGALTVTIVWRAGRPKALVDAPQPPSWSRLMAGRPAAEAARMAGLLGESCPTAHEAAARAAFGLPSRPADSRRIAIENLREHALRCLGGWPRALGWPAEAVPTLEDELRCGGEALARALFGPEGLPGDVEALEDWMRRGASTPARALDHVWRRWDGRWGRCALPLWRPGDRIGGVDWSEAELDGGPFETSVAARVADARLMHEVEARRGRGVPWRLLARLVDADRLLRGLRDEGPLAGSSSPAPGVGAAEVAGGTVLAMGAVSDGRVSRYEQLTPTDCALHPSGLLARMLASAERAPAVRFESLAAMIVEAVDPRRPTQLIDAAASVPERGRAAAS